MTKESEVTETALVEVPEKFKSQVDIFNERASFDELLKACREKAAAAGTDVSTAKARDEIKSIAFKIRKVGVVVDEAGGKLAEDMRKKVSAIDKNRREYKGALVELAAETRKPVTDWEEAEEARIKKIRETMKAITDLGIVPFGSTVAQIKERVRDLDDIEIDETFGELQEQAEDRARAAAELLEQALAHAIEAARLAEENERLRAAQAETERQAEAERAARDAKERAENEARDKAAADALAQAAAQQAEIDRLNEVAAEAQRRADEAERREQEAKRQQEEAAAAETKRLADEAAERKRVKAQELADAKAEKERLEQLKAQRDKRIGEAVEDLTTLLEVNATFAKQAVDAIIAGKVRNITFE